MPPNCVSRLGREVQTAVHRLLVYGTAINQEKKMAPNIQQQPFVTEHSKYTRLLRKRVRVCITTVHENSSRRGKIASGGILSSFSLFRVFFFLALSKHIYTEKKAPDAGILDKVSDPCHDTRIANWCPGRASVFWLRSSSDSIESLEIVFRVMPEQTKLLRGRAGA